MKKLKKITLIIIIIISNAILFGKNQKALAFHDSQAYATLGSTFSASANGLEQSYWNTYCLQQGALLVDSTMTYNVSMKVEIRGNVATFYNSSGRPIGTVSAVENNVLAAILTPNSYIAGGTPANRQDDWWSIGMYVDASSSTWGDGSITNYSRAQAALYNYIGTWINVMSANGVSVGWGYTSHSDAYDNEYAYGGTALSEIISNIYTFNVDLYYLSSSSYQNILLVNPSTATWGKPTLIQPTEVTVEKIWNDSNNAYKTRPETINVTLYANDSVAKDLDGNIMTATLSTSNWSKKFSNLPLNDDSGNRITYSAIESSTPAGYAVGYSGTTITNTLQTTSVTVKKVWDDENNRDGKRKNATVTLYETIDGITKKSTDANGKNRTAPLGTSNNAKASFNNLPTHRQGNAIIYTVDETYVPDRYTKISVKGNATDGFTITNKHVPERIPEITVNKVWDDVSNKEKTRPEKITIALINGNTIVETKELSGNGNTWTTKFENLYKYENGEEINYEVEEIGVPESTDECAVTVTVDGSIENGFTITNKFVPKTEYRVHKKWDDDNNRDGLRPGSIKITLYADGEKVKTDGDGKSMTNPQTITPDSEGNWIYYFTNLLKYNSKEEIIEYTVKEESVPNRYEVDIKMY